mmetsp:Transcript_23593/g.55515  ORF Transcript_23593/g.55515 Transcript_23593/m.55515 type:complete len:179 (+) Transcript_23593:2374-2910(+)
MGEGSVMRGAVGSSVDESVSEEELFSEEQEASLLMLLLLPLRVRDLDLLFLRLLEDLRLDDPRLRLDVKEATDPTDKSFLPFIDAGDLGGSWFEAVVFVVFFSNEYDGGDDSTLWLNTLIVSLGWSIVLRSIGLFYTNDCIVDVPKFLLTASSSKNFFALALLDSISIRNGGKCSALC